MKNLLTTIALVGLGLVGLGNIGCTPDKSRACAGCTGAMLRDCEEAYEECDSVAHCRRTDIRRDFAEDRCLSGN